MDMDMDNTIDIYFKKEGKQYKTGYGIPFECVELIRRFFSTVKGVSFPSVVDAVDFFYKIDKLSNSKIDYKLKTFSYPLFKRMNDPKSKFLGIKTNPKKLAKNIEQVGYNVIRI